MSLEILVESGIIDSLCRDLGRLVEVVFWFLTASDFFRPIFWLFGSCEIIEAPLDVFPNWPREIMALCDNFFIVRRMVCVRGGGLAYQYRRLQLVGKPRGCYEADMDSTQLPVTIWNVIKRAKGQSSIAIWNVIKKY